MSVAPPIDPPGIEPVDLRAALESRYLAYALSTITARALPDVRDGLKPVHRRVLYAMRVLRLDPGTGFKKSARVVGDVIGKFHPHGDQSVYDALVRLAQDFAQRFPLVDGQGNFGNIDGDNAAAMRYTEARLTAVAAHLLDGIDEDAVDFRDTYDGEESEPVVLPADFPNLLANGSSGIAVGMATSIPPHNVEELCDAALHLIAHPHADAEALMRFVPGPDFPTGGVLIEPRASVLEAYRTGRGGFRLRAAWRVEEGARGVWQAVVTEIPYQVQKSRLIEKIAELLEGKKLPLVGDIRDESAEDVRLVIEPRARTVDAAMMMEQLFRLTELEARIPLNMNVLSMGRVPKVMGLPHALGEWLAHRRDVLLRRAAHRLAKIAARLEVLGGYLVAYLNLDEVIRIIRNSDEPKPELIAAFALSDVQAEAILNMRLRALRRLEEMEIRTERDALEAEQARLLRLTASEAEQWAEIGGQIGRLRTEFGKGTPLGRRRTAFAEAPSLAAEALETSFALREPVTVVLSREGWLRAVKGHGIDEGKLAFKAGDALAALIPAQTTDKLVVFAGDGRAYTLDVAGLPGGRGLGEPLRLMVDMADGAGIVAARVHKPGATLLLASRGGNGFLVAEGDVVAQTRKGRAVMTLKAGDALAIVAPGEGDTVAVLSDERRLLVFPADELPRLSRGQGVRLQRVKGRLAAACLFAMASGLRLQNGSTARSVESLGDFVGSRAGAGKPLPKGYPVRGGFAP